MGEERWRENACRVFVGQTEGKKSLGRTRCEDSTETDTNRNRMGGRD
jgi:hypothetical protein